MEGIVSIQGSYDVARMLDEIAELGGKKPRAFLRERAGAVARYFAEATQPVLNVDALDPNNPDGASKKAREVGQAAVRRDIRRIYVPIAKVYAEIKNKIGVKIANAFRRLVVSDPAKADALLKQAGIRGAALHIGAWDGGARHRQMRNARGRVNSGTKPMLVLDGKALAHYTKQIVKRVGWAKSGWHTAAKMIPGARFGAGVTAWMRQPAPGTGIDRTEGHDPHVILKNNVRYAGSLVPQRQIDRAGVAFELSLTKELKIVLEKLHAKHRALLTSST